MKILVDTSVWIEYFRRNEPYFSQLEKILLAGEITTLPVIFAELLQGAKNKREREILTMMFSGLHAFPSENSWTEAGEFASVHQLSSKGIGLIDAFIFLLAKNNDCYIWTLDKKLLQLCNEENVAIFTPL